ncbi:hypothetical protein KSB_47370 [Ktedonobacter robiniae]|uniref:Uncharacterized protein n=1 Tax=Ktedonobacter robiniae TaxID=2778365 RepID=A0ABQ3UV36_9CHLR|nr:hypothetical protein KSB_47370 [Ktedonobacter robiniae]
MPRISRPDAAMLQLIGVHLPKFEAPLTDRFVGEHDSPLCHEFFDITKTERKTEIQPDTMTNNHGRKAVPFVG